MNNDYSLNDDGRASGRSCAKAANKLHWFQKTRIYTVFTNPMFIVCLILFICIVVAIYWNFIRPRQYKTIYKQDGNVPSRRHILGSKIFKEQLLEKFGKKFFFKKKY